MNIYSNRQPSLVRPNSLLDRGMSRLVDGMERADKHPQVILAGSAALAAADVLMVAATDLEVSSGAAGGVAIGALTLACLYAREAYDDFRHRND